jgi:hypothetical protein
MFQSFVHVSTAYIHGYRTEINEVVYPMEESPDVLLEYLEHFDNRMWDFLSKKILKKYPNTYTYTKSLAEYLLLKQGKNLPIGKETHKLYFSKVSFFYSISNNSTSNYWRYLERTYTCK